MHKFLVLLQQSYKQKLKSKTFIITTVLYIIIMLGFAFFQDIKDLFGDDEPAKIVSVYNDTQSVSLDALTLGDDYKVQYEATSSKVEQQVKDDKTDYGLVFNEVNEKLVAKLYSFEPLPLSEQTFFNEALSELGTSFAFEKIQLTSEEQALIEQSLPIIDMISLNDASSKSAEEKQAGMFGSYLVGIVIYIFVIGYLSIITTDVASEKGSRALEMLLVSIKPETHFKSKVLAILLVAMTQFVLIVIVAFAILMTKSSGDMLGQVTSLVGELQASYIIFVVLFLVLTLVLYLIIGALFGSLVSKVEEASQVMMPATVIIIIAFYVMIMAFDNPDAILVKVFSYVPFTAGMVMPMRLGGSDISLLEPTLACILLLVTVLALYKFSLVYYKRSVLTYSTGGVFTKLKRMFKLTN